jgi:glycosyltransferase involved in cell wall biosynthesis
MFVSNRRSHDPQVAAFRPTRDWVSRVRRRLRRKWIERDFARYRSVRPAGLEPFQDSRSPAGWEVIRQIPDCDVVHLHWIANGFIDYENFFATIPFRTPVVWTMHDMNPFTGGCHYDMGCSRYKDHCGTCPQLGSRMPQDLAYRIWERKRSAFERVPAGRLHFVTPSRWLAEEAKRSGLIKQFPIAVIPYGLDLEAFAPRNRSYAREVLGLAPDAQVILFLADGLDNRRKGFALLAEALAGLGTDANINLVSLGHNQAPAEVKVPWMNLGFLDNDRLLSLIYSAADLFVIPSLQDNLPNTVLEALACGTPIAGFAAGGIPELVRPGTTGLLAPVNDVGALRTAILQLLQDPAELERLRANCRHLAMQEYALEQQAERYAELYGRILAGKEAVEFSGNGHGSK